MFYMSTSLFSSVSVVVSSRSGEGQRTQVLPVSAGWQLHAGEYRLVHCVSGTRGAIRGSASTKLLINCTGLIELIDFMETVKKKKKLNIIESLFPVCRQSTGPWLCSSWPSSSTITTQDRCVSSNSGVFMKDLFWNPMIKYPKRQRSF